MLEIASIMEMLMVLCFGISWPINVRKAWKARSTKGISLFFYFLIWIGYVFAIIGKFILIYYHLYITGTASSWTEVVKWYVMFFYFFNFAMLCVAIFTYFRNRRIESREA